MLINNKSAVKYGNAILANYSLTFSGVSKLWKGATANIERAENSAVHGVVYTMDKADIEHLDRQEFGYDPIQIEVKLIDSGDLVTCRSYTQKDFYRNSECKLPSKLYKEVIIKGARENGLAEEYIEGVIVATPDNNIVDCGPPGFVL